MRDVLAIIPARSGSKGIPRKNVLPLAGKPLIAHTIEAARAAAHVTRIVVSTDDTEIGSISASFGAEVVSRPADLAGDLAKSEAALLHCLDTLENQGYVPDLVVFLQCTSPLTRAEDIDATIDALDMQEADSALAVTPFHYFLWHCDATGDAVGINHDKRERLMRQQRDAEFLETGAVYVMKTAGFRDKMHRFFGKTAMYAMPSERVLEIDEPYDFTRAEERLAASTANTNPFVGRTFGALVMDFDGVHTDDRVLVDEEGREAVFCSRRDGMGIELLLKAGWPMIAISKERIGIIARRCEKLGIPCLYGEDDKLTKMTAWLSSVGIPISETVYIGNDINDLECLTSEALGVVPADAHPAAIAVANLILTNKGGKGAIRELADLLLQHRNGPSCPPLMQ